LATIDVDSVADLLNTTLETFEKDTLTDLMLDDQEHYFVPQIMVEERVELQSGKSIIFDAVTDSTPARHHGLHDKDQILVQDVIAQGTVPWRFTTNNWSVDVHEIAMNRDPSMIANLTTARRMQMWGGLSNSIETAGWDKPATSSDVTTPWGIKMYITKKITGSSASTSTGEFGGGNPAGYTSGAAGISSTTETRWTNWTQQYVNPSDDDLVDKMRTAKYHTHFISPAAAHFTNEQRGPDKYVWYMPYDILAALEKVAESKNENLGKDLAPFDDGVRFRKNPLRAVPKLDDDSDDPVYAINWSVMYPVGLSGKFMQVSDVAPVPGMRNNVAQHVELCWNLVCKNRRRQACLAKTANND